MSEDKKFVSDIFGTVNSEKPKEESGWLIKSIVSKLKGRGVESKKRQIEERKLDIELAKLDKELEGDKK